MYVPPCWDRYKASAKVHTLPGRLSFMDSPSKENAPSNKTHFNKTARFSQLIKLVDFR